MWIPLYYIIYYDVISAKKRKKINNRIVNIFLNQIFLFVSIRDASKDVS